VKYDNEWITLKVRQMQEKEVQRIRAELAREGSDGK